MKYCSECGNKLPENPKYCPYCGYNLQKESADSRFNGVEYSNNTMKNHRILFITLICIALFLSCYILLYVNQVREKQTVSFSSNPAAIESASLSVVMLDCLDENNQSYCTGSAFAAFEPGVFVTNYHVIGENVAKIVARTESGLIFELENIKAFDKEKDIAILSTKSLNDIMPLTLGDAESLEKGEQVVAIGSPLGFINTVSTGMFSGYTQIETGKEIQFNAPISHGSSGGALFNDDGEVIGITYASYEGGQNLNVAIPINYVIALKEKSDRVISVTEFYQKFSVRSYSVEDVLRKRDTLSVNKAVLTGYIAKVVSGQCWIVSNNNEIKEYQEISERYNALSDEISKAHSITIRSISNGSFTTLDHEGFKILENSEAGKLLQTFEKSRIIVLKDATRGNLNLFRSCHIGDKIVAEVRLYAGNNREIYEVDILDKSDILLNP